MPRLYHTKSKTGCARCRARRVKCNEVRPICGGCQKHNVECIYDRLGYSATSPSIASTAGPSSTQESPGVAPVTVTLEEGRRRRLQELELLHFYTVSICPDLPGTCIPEVLEIWRTDCVRMSFDYEPLLNSMLALSLLGMVRMGYRPKSIPEDDLRNQRSQYLEVTLQEHRKAVGSLDQKLADPISFASSLLAIDSIAGLRDRPLRPYSPPMEWLRLSQGAHHIVRSARSMVQQDPNSKVRRMTEYGEAFVNAARADIEGNRSQFAYLMDSMDIKVTQSSGDAKVYDDTIQFVGSMWAAQQLGQDIRMMARRLVVFSILVDPRFVELVAAYDSRALVIIAHLFAVAHYSRDLWWIGDTPSREILAISKFLGAKWRQEMTWPVQVAQS